MMNQRRNQAHLDIPQTRNARSGAIAMKVFAAVGWLIAMPALAQQPKFEIADVHISPTSQGFAQNFGGVLRAGRYVNRDATMIDLIKLAYGVTEDDIAGGPGWLGSALYDVVAKVPDGT